MQNAARATTDDLNAYEEKDTRICRVAAVVDPLISDVYIICRFLMIIAPSHPFLGCRKIRRSPHMYNVSVVMLPSALPIIIIIKSVLARAHICVYKRRQHSTEKKCVIHTAQ